MAAMRILHLSDVHVTVPLAAMPWRQMLNKRLLGAANLVLRRGEEFAHAVEKLAVLGQFAEEQQVDLVICTGDYTALGTEPELQAARRAVAGLTGRRYGYVTVPGNHDLYMPDGVRDRRFERHFADLLHSDLPEACVDGLWPSVRLVGDEVAVVAVNSARANPQPWRSNGVIPDVQLRALRSLCFDPRIADRFVFVITHYAPRRADGTPDRPSHGLKNADAFLDACQSLRRGAILHGHIHQRFQLALPNVPLRIFGAGSTTCERRESFWLFDVNGPSARALPGRWSEGRYVVSPDAAIDF
jgi:3',5'-cyclic AMP phosphodiesterase CpdA